MIMNCVGVVTYTALHRKFPEYFKFFKECDDVLSRKEGNIPNEIKNCSSKFE